MTEVKSNLRGKQLPSLVQFTREPATLVGLDYLQFLRHSLQALIGSLQGGIGSLRSGDVDHGPDQTDRNPCLVPHDVGTVQKMAVRAVGKAKSVFGGK
ncbi:MAG: hypothetical protein U0361_13010 [Nitrospiraceae bacterium]